MRITYRISIWYYLLLGIGGGLIVGFFLVSDNNTVSPLVVSQERDVTNKMFLEGEKVIVPLIVVNRTKESITVRKISASCGCTSLFVREKEILTPFEILGQQSIPLKATIDTDGVMGDRTVLVVVRFDTNKKQSAVTSEIKLHVRPGMRCLTTLGSIADEDDSEKITKKLFVGDAFPNPGIEIESVSSSLPDIIYCNFQKVEDQSVYNPQDYLLTDFQKYLMQRYEIEFSFASSNNPFVAHITVTPGNKEQNILTIPVQYEGSGKKPLFFPPEILITQAELSFNRLIEVRVVDCKECFSRDMHINRKTVPDWLELKSFKKTEEYFLASFKILYLPTERNGTSIVFEDDSGRQIAALQVRFLGVFSNR